MKKYDYNELKMKARAAFKHGDIAVIARRAGMSPWPIYNAMRKNSWESLTKHQFEAMTTVVEYLSEREEIMAKAEQL